MRRNITLIVGARPNFMKAYPILKSLQYRFNVTLIHTGQHFDAKMSDVFFNQLGFPEPDIHFELTSKTRAGEINDKLYINNTEYLKNIPKVINDLINYDNNSDVNRLGQLGEIYSKLSVEFNKNRPDLVIVFGDVTSTLSASLAAKKLNIDIAHVESGLRSNDLTMPEEVNRILTDNIAKYYFITEQSGLDNLRNEGLDNGHLYLVGNTMIDCLMMFKDRAFKTKYNEITFGLKKGDYILVTLHRPCNVDNIDKLGEIGKDLIILSETENIIFPMHPRTIKNLFQHGQSDIMHKMRICEPLGYLEFTCLQANAKYVVTDSGGVQEETSAFGVLCYTLRPNTERPSTLIENGGTNTLISDIKQIPYLFVNRVNI